MLQVASRQLSHQQRCIEENQSSPVSIVIEGPYVVFSKSALSRSDRRCTHLDVQEMTESIAQNRPTNADRDSWDTVLGISRLHVGIIYANQHGQQEWD